MAEAKVLKLKKDHPTLGKKGSDLHITSHEQEQYFANAGYLTEEEPPVNKSTAEEVIAAIHLATTEEQVTTLTSGDTRKTVVSSAAKKIEELKA